MKTKLLRETFSTFFPSNLLENNVARQSHRPSLGQARGKPEPAVSSSIPFEVRKSVLYVKKGKHTWFQELTTYPKHTRVISLVTSLFTSLCLPLLASLLSACCLLTCLLSVVSLLTFFLNVSFRVDILCRTVLQKFESRGVSLLSSPTGTPTPKAQKPCSLPYALVEASLLNQPEVVRMAQELQRHAAGIN